MCEGEFDPGSTPGGLEDADAVLSMSCEKIGLNQYIP